MHPVTWRIVVAAAQMGAKEVGVLADNGYMFVEVMNICYSEIVGANKYHSRVGLYSRCSREAIVDLPHPDAPTTATHSPSAS